jgi:hypothetical protein
MTTAQAFADYLGMTPASATWAFDPICKHCDSTLLFPALNEDPTIGDDFECNYCDNRFHALEAKHIFTATSPLAEKPDHGWLYVMVQAKHFHWLDPNTTGFFAVAMDDVGHERRAIAHNPIHAVARVLIAADPTLRARLDACEDRKEYAG